MFNETLFFTVVYPQALPFFKDVCDCIRSQTRKDFDMIVVNDGCATDTINECLEHLHATILDSAGTISGNRMLGIEYARMHQYRYLFFCDADDTFFAERHERTIREFETSGADVVVCNLNVADETCKPVIMDYFSQEIPSDRWIDADFLTDKNIMGMSNTALRVGSLSDSLYVPDIPIVDWYLFTTLLLHGLRARYISDSLVNYRQHNANMIGITSFDVPSFRRLANHKMAHYQKLVENGYVRFLELYNESEKLITLSDDEINDIINRQLLLHKQPLWWQIITA